MRNADKLSSVGVRDGDMVMMIPVAAGASAGAGTGSGYFSSLLS